MILIDTSVWVDHFRRAEPHLVAILERADALTHPFVIGELACGNLRNRNEILTMLSALPGVPVVTDQEVLRFIERRRLMGRGIGYVDAHLLASTVIADGAELWTRDQSLQTIASELGAAFAT